MNRCPRTWFSTELHTGKRLLRTRLSDLLTAPKRRGVLPILLTLLCVGTFGTMVACGPSVEGTSEPLRYEEVDLSALWQQDWGAGEPLSITAEERADYTALLRERMDAAYAVLCDCLGYTPAATPRVGVMSMPSGGVSTGVNQSCAISHFTDWRNATAVLVSMTARQFCSLARRNLSSRSILPAPSTR